MNDKNKKQKKDLKAEKTTEQERKLLALQTELKETREKMGLLETRKTGNPSSARLDQQSHSVEYKQAKLMEHLSKFKRPPGNVLNKAHEAGEQKEDADGNNAKAGSEPSADKGGDIPQSAGSKKEPLKAIQPKQFLNLLLERIMRILSQQRFAE